LKLDRVFRVNKLFSFYGPLLTERQQEFVELYYYHDLSLGEIAEQQEISRQAVYDNLKRSESALEDYEKKLGLAKHYEKVNQELDKLEKIFTTLSEGAFSENELKQFAKTLKKLKKYQEGESV